MGIKRDEFSEKTKSTLAKRAANFCSNPDCNCLAVTPHSKEDKTVTYGEAAHIKAAEENGPRYDKNQSSYERRSITNGIWLCNICHKIVDSDKDNYTVDVLESWKYYHEEFIRSQNKAIKLIKTVAQPVSLEEADIARRLINRLGVRRVFYNPFQIETPRAVTGSVRDIRGILIESKNEIQDPNSPLISWINSMAALCNKFLNQVEILNLNWSPYNRNKTNKRIEDDKKSFYTTLAKYRGNIIPYLVDIIKEYNIEIENDIRTKIGIK